ncbi:MAG: PEBP family protein [Alphaproteobacteria bacterium]|nr:PEBP family protein [Alphaproteobacteria bacterium]
MKRVVFILASSLLAVMPTYAETIEADVWADNWFAFYVNETLVKEDSVSINTERSFNKESFRFQATRPYVLNFVAKDFKANDTGLEYIGSGRQQMGDGGLIAQFLSDGEVIAVTNFGWKCLTVHTAPLNKSCEKSRNPVAGVGDCGFDEIAEPTGWKALDFDDSSWPAAFEYSEREVGPKDGYDRVRWNGDAQLIWGADLEQSNTLLCRKTIK